MRAEAAVSGINTSLVGQEYDRCGQIRRQNIP